jgi:hypothetical protein
VVLLVVRGWLRGVDPGAGAGTGLKGRRAGPPKRFIAMPPVSPGLAGRLLQGRSSG